LLTDWPRPRLNKRSATATAAAATEIIKRLVANYLLTVITPAPTTAGEGDVPRHGGFHRVCL
jgi:hypothetical protein